MEEEFPADDVFILKLTSILDANFKNEEFGVSELAEKMGMNRVALYRRIRSKTSRSASKFICEYRLKRASVMLQNHAGTISKVALDVGFSSVSYFIKCFHDYFGYPPGDVLKNNGSLYYSGVGKSILKKIFYRIKVIFIIECILFILIAILFCIHLFL